MSEKNAEVIVQVLRTDTRTDTRNPDGETGYKVHIPEQGVFRIKYTRVQESGLLLVPDGLICPLQGMHQSGPFAGSDFRF